MTYILHCQLFISELCLILQYLPNSSKLYITQNKLANDRTNKIYPLRYFNVDFIFLVKCIYSSLQGNIMNYIEHCYAIFNHERVMDKDIKINVKSTYMLRRQIV